MIDPGYDMMTPDQKGRIVKEVNQVLAAIAIELPTSS